MAMQSTGCYEALRSVCRSSSGTGSECSALRSSSTEAEHRQNRITGLGNFMDINFAGLSSVLPCSASCLCTLSTQGSRGLFTSIREQPVQPTSERPHASQCTDWVGERTACRVANPLSNAGTAYQRPVAPRRRRPGHPGINALVCTCSGSCASYLQHEPAHDVSIASAAAAAIPS